MFCASMLFLWCLRLWSTNKCLLTYTLTYLLTYLLNIAPVLLRALYRTNEELIMKNSRQLALLRIDEHRIFAAYIFTSDHKNEITRKYGWNSGERRGWSRTLGWGRGWDVGRSTLPHWERVCKGGYAPLRKKWIFHLKWRVLRNFERYFWLCLRQKNVELSAWSGGLVDVEDALLESSEYSVRIMGLASFGRYLTYRHHS